MDVDDAELSSAQLLQQEAALVLSHIRDTCRTTQKAANSVVSGVNKLSTLFLDVLKDKLKERLSHKDGYIELKDVESVIDIFREQSFFAGVGSKHLLDQYIQEKSGGKDVVLEKVVLESCTVIRNGRACKKSTKFGYRMKVHPQLEQLLNCEDVLQCVLNPATSQDGMFKSVTDGLFYKYHPVVQKAKELNVPVLVFDFHVDDVDPCDALKSKAGNQNLRLFYWRLLNIHPKKRSTLRAINLLAIVKTKVAKEKGNKIFMQDFIDVLMKLGTDGLELTIRGRKMFFLGILLFGAADNPAACNIGGFKETHFALRPCRVCLVKNGELCAHFREDLELIRKNDEHKKYVKLVLLFNETSVESGIEIVDVTDLNNDEDEDDNMDEDEEEEEEEELFETRKIDDHPNPSINYGIKSESILSKLPGFSVTNCLPQDVLHLLAEGIVEHVCRLMLRELCVPPKIPNKRPKPLMKLAKVNDVIQNAANLGQFGSSKPSPILIHHITGSKLRQSASQMLVLVKIMPFLMYSVPKCSQEKLGLVVLLNNLVDMCMSYEFSESDVDFLGDLIDLFGRSFKKLYPTVKTLKLHAMIHLPTQISLFGPLRQQACFHFEAMHSKYTSLGPTIHSMKNFAFSTASRNLIARSAEILKDKDSGKFLYSGDTLRGTSNVCVGSLAEKDCLLQKFPHLQPNSVITKVTEIVEHSNHWSEGVAILLEKNPQQLFGRISSIYEIEGEYTFVYNKFETVRIPSLNAFLISKVTQEVDSINYTELEKKFPVPRFSFNYKNQPLAYLLPEIVHEERREEIRSQLKLLIEEETD